MRRLYYVHRDGPDGRGLRWTVDGPEDLEQVRRIWERLDALGSGPHLYEAIMRVAAEVGTRRGVLVLSTHNTCAALGEAAVEQVLRVYAEASSTWDRSSNVEMICAYTWMVPFRPRLFGCARE